MSIAGTNKLNLIYEGSVKRVFECPWQKDSLLFQFTDDYSVFDWGKMPDSIENKGRALALFGASLFERLSEPAFWGELEREALSSAGIAALPGAAGWSPTHNFLQQIHNYDSFKGLKEKGLSSHFQGLVDAEGKRLSIAQAACNPADVYMQVRKAGVQHPENFSVLNQSVFYYPAQKTSSAPRLVPLEVVFRFGAPQGSSLIARLMENPSYAKVLGLSSVPREGEMFDRVVLEFFSKLEPKDRLLSVQEALLISGLSPEEFTRLVELAELTALACYYIFACCKIELWDGKFEFVTGGGSLMLADSIGPDELRLLYRGEHLSKEMIRQAYRGSIWEKSLKQAQSLARERGSSDWKDICRNELNAQPAPLQKDVKVVANQLYGMLANVVSGCTLFAGMPDLDAFVKSAGRIDFSKSEAQE